MAEETETQDTKTILTPDETKIDWLTFTVKH